MTKIAMISTESKKLKEIEVGLQILVTLINNMIRYFYGKREHVIGVNYRTIIYRQLNE